MEMEKVILTGMRPTGTLHLGHYFGVIPELLKLQNEGSRLFLMIADLHALTTLKHTKNIGKDSLSLATMYLAAGINPQKSTIFIQSQIPEHSELAIILSMITPVPMLELNPTYKEMKEETSNLIKNNLGLLAYPVLQAADILVYKATHVPVGKDQEPHLEITREIARKFNSRFGNIFPEPKTILQKESKIFSLQNPDISLLDIPEEIRKKIKTAVTDSGKEIKYDEKKKPAVSNLLTIYSLFFEKPIKEIEKIYKDKGYAEFKKDLAEIIINKLAPLQKRFKEIENNPSLIKSILESGAKEAKKNASQTMEAVKRKIGFV